MTTTEDYEILMEATRRYNQSRPYCDPAVEIALEAIRLTRAGWKPIDPDLLVVRKVLAEESAKRRWSVMEPEDFLEGKLDGECIMVYALAAYKAGKETQ